MKRFLIALAAGLMLLPASPAAASESGANRAVRRYVDYHYMPSAGVSSHCYQSSRNHYRCSFTAWETSGDNSVGNARVTQYGNRYTVRIAW